MANLNEFRTVIKTGYDDKGWTNENSLANAYLTRPDVISPVITHLQGRESDKFPLSFLTEGQKGGIMNTKLNDDNSGIGDVQYTYKVIGRMKRGDVLVKSDYTEAAGDKPGLGHTYFYLYFKTKWIKRSHSINSEKGTRARVQREPEQVGQYWKYTCQLITGDGNCWCPVAETQSGIKWSMTGAASVSESDSKGTESNVVTPGEMKNQINIIRRSFTIAGNMANKYVECTFNINGATTKLWVDFEVWQHELNFKQDCEEELWYSEYNRDAQGEIHLKDEDSGLPIPMGAGVFQQIPNKDTYAELTYKKIKNTISDVLTGATDTGKMMITCYAGMGGMEDFDTAMKGDLRANWSLIASDLFVSKTEGGLKYGNYFKAYEHVDGHMVVLKHLPMLDYGSQAEIAPRHPRSGKPITSHQLHFIDQSMYDGELNVKMVHQRGRAYKVGILEGMAKLPSMYFNGNGNTMRDIATDKDRSSVHFLASKGICIRRNTHCFSLICELD